MREPRPVTLEGHGVRLEPLSQAHTQGLAAAVTDGRLWELWFTAVPQPDDIGAYIEAALAGQAAGHMLPWAVRDVETGVIVGSTRYHDIVPAIDRVEIGYTWYAKRWQRSHVNTSCKLLLLAHAFDDLGCAVVGLRTDIRDVLVTHVLDAEPDHRFEFPTPSIWPFLTALTTTALFIGSIFTPWAVVWGAIPVAVTLIGWFWPKQGETRRNCERERRPA